MILLFRGYRGIFTADAAESAPMQTISEASSFNVIIYQIEQTCSGRRVAIRRSMEKTRTSRGASVAADIDK